MATGLDCLKTVREEDYVEYFIYPINCAVVDECKEDTQLKLILNRVDNTINEYLKDYLWHKDEFRLAVRTNASCALIEDAIDNNEQRLPGHLYGVTHFGDNIEDEWFIVSLLMKIAKTMPDVIIRVADSDGEFLLIEAADYLPDWADPVNCNEKVFIHNGAVHIIPSTIPIASIKDAISTIINGGGSTEASQDIQKAIRQRIHLYPEQIDQNFHFASAYLPVGVAGILKRKPNFIAAAVRAFCNRDSIDLKACRAMKYFPPEMRTTCRIKFTKCLYAMLMHSKFVPDKRVGWHLPSPLSKQYKAHLLGVKIACGFEILASQAKPATNHGIENDREWICYVRKLRANGYFNQLLENSREYNHRLNQAKEYFVSQRDSMSCQRAPIVGQEILELSATLDTNTRQTVDAQTISGCDDDDDDDSWLNIDAHELDQMLQERYGPKSKEHNVHINGCTDRDAAVNLTTNLNQFLNHVSGIDGAEFPNAAEKASRAPCPKPPERTKRKSQNRAASNCNAVRKPVDDDRQSDCTANKVDFDPSSFTSALQNILDIVIPEDNWESDSDMSAFEDDDGDGGAECNQMQEYMAQMDLELTQTNVGRSFEKKTTTQTQKEAAVSDCFADVEDFMPVDIDMNALKNVLESYQAQMGEAGPISNMLGPMGIHLHTDAEANGRARAHPHSTNTTATTPKPTTCDPCEKKRLD